MFNNHSLTGSGHKADISPGLDLKGPRAEQESEALVQARGFRAFRGPNLKEHRRTRSTRLPWEGTFELGLEE